MIVANNLWPVNYNAVFVRSIGINKIDQAVKGL